jgi:Undecaprenyl-phosphate galactose phosphotransferase WbaP
LVVPDLIGLQSLWVEPRDLGGIMALEMRNNLLIPHSRRLKRCMDVALCTLLIPLTLPLMALIALAIKLDSRGPVMFVQRRLGVGQRQFSILKFRTMHADAEVDLKDILARDPGLQREYDTYHKLRHDPRVTWAGNLLRKSSLDELPQLWNVLRGDMSLIGPRPYMPEELPKFHGSEGIILQVPPGLTGLWQVRGRTAVAFEDRLEIDIYYIRNWSLWLDLHILFRTFSAVLRGEGEH